MNKLYKSVLSVSGKLKKMRLTNVIASVPPELEAQFDRRQLKKSLYRIRNLTAAVMFFRLVLMIVYSISGGHVIFGGRLAQLIYSEKEYFYPINCYNLAAGIMFFLLTGYFLKKDKRLILWLICYVFILLNFVSVIISMLFTESDNQILYLFSTTLFLNIFIPDFKPIIFIPTAVLFYLVTSNIIMYRYSLFEGGGTELLISDAFFAVLIIKLLHYNGIVKAFVDLSKINALNEKLMSLSLTDELTKLNNRRSFLAHMDIIWNQGRRLQFPVSVLMIDVDYFKKYNDSLGHLEGDKALIAIAQCIKRQMKRDTDFIARFGGEEFVCLFPFLEKDNALHFAKKIVQSVENMKMQHPLSECSKYVTISAGMASAIPDDNNSQTQLLDEADKALYMAKKSGRNRIVAG